MRFFVKLLLGLFLLSIICAGGLVSVLYYAHNQLRQQALQESALQLPVPTQTTDNAGDIAQRILNDQKVQLSMEDIEGIIWNHPSNKFTALDLSITPNSNCRLQASIPSEDGTFINIDLIFDAELQNNQFTRYDVHKLHIGELDTTPWITEYIDPQQLANSNLQYIMMTDPQLNQLISSIQHLRIENQQLVVQLKEDAIHKTDDMLTEGNQDVTPQ